MVRKVFPIAMSVCLGLLLSASAANASSIYQLTSNHCSTPSDCGAPNTVFGLVILDQNGSNVDFTVKLNTPTYAWAKTGSADFLAFKFNATDVVVGDITVNQTFAGQTLVAQFAAQPAGFNGDGTGQFSFGINCTTCGNGMSTVVSSDLIFHVANATIADLTAPNNLGNIFVADIGRVSNGATGPIDASTLCLTCGPGTFEFPGVPEPTSLILLGSGLLGAATRFRRRLGR